METIEIRFKHSEEEYLRAYRKYFLTQRRPLFMMLLATGVLLVGIYFLLSGGDVALTVAFIATGALLFGLLISSSILVPRQHFRNDPRFRSEYLLRFSDTGIEFHTKEIESKLSWQFYKEASETDDFFFLANGFSVLTVIPKRAFASTDEEIRFRQLMDDKF